MTDAHVDPLSDHGQDTPDSAGTDRGSPYAQEADHASGRVARSSEPREASASHSTVEGEVRARVAAHVGGLRGSLETSLPVVIFTIVWLITQALQLAVSAAVVGAVVAYLARRAQGSETRFVGQGLFGIVVAAAIAGFTGRAENVFLPGIIQNGLGALVLAGSLAARWPVAGFVIGEVLDDRTGWRDDAGIVRLSDRLTLVMLAPMVIRFAVQLPFYLAGDVGWLGVSRVVLGWPLHAGALALLGLILLRGNTPLRRVQEDANVGS